MYLQFVIPDHLAPAGLYLAGQPAQNLTCKRKQFSCFNGRMLILSILYFYFALNEVA
jgi:hypothetical protein